MTETNRVEYKSKLTDNLEKEIVAFLNYSDGGVVYIGVDKEGKTVGIDDCDATQLKIKDKLITSKERINQRLWNPIALKEAVINAIVHNDWISELPPVFEIYDDRLEITFYY